MSHQAYAVRCTVRIVLELSHEQLMSDRLLSDALLEAIGNPNVGIGGPFKIDPTVVVHAE